MKSKHQVIFERLYRGAVQENEKPAAESKEEDLPNQDSTAAAAKDAPDTGETAAETADPVTASDADAPVPSKDGADAAEDATAGDSPGENPEEDAVFDPCAPVVVDGPDERIMPYTRMLLYACADMEHPLVMRKAFSVLAKDSSPRVALKAPDIMQLLYPNGLTGRQIFKVPVEEAEVAEIIARMRGMHVEKQEEVPAPTKEKAGAKGKAAAKDKGGKKGAKADEVKEEPKQDPDAVAEVTSDQFAYHYRGAALLAACGSRYRLRDLFLDFRRVKPGDDEIHVPTTEEVPVKGAADVKGKK